MTTFVALLRGVNVGAARRVKMADVRAALAGAGLGEVTTHLQSGNVVLVSRARRNGAVEDAVEDALEGAFGAGIDVVARTAAELDAVTRRNPFTSRVRNASALHVAFLKTRPPAAAVKALDAKSFGADEFVVDGSELFLHYPNGSGRSKMTAVFFERALGTRATVRNWNVTTALARLAAELSG